MSVSATASASGEPLNTPVEYRAGPKRLPASVTRQSLRLLVGTLALGAFLILRLAQPLIRIVLTALGLLSLLMAIFYRIASAPPHSPFWLLLGFAFACGVALMVYEHLVQALSREPDWRRL